MISMPSRSLFAVAYSIALMTSLVRPCAVAVEHFQHDQARSGGEAAVSLLTLPAVAGDEAGDVRAVAVCVARGPRDAPLCEVVEGDDAVAELGSGLDAGVDHRDADAAAARRLHRQAQSAAQRIGRGRRLSRDDYGVGRDRHDGVVFGQRADLVDRQRGRDRPDAAVHAADGVTLRPQRRRERRRIPVLHADNDVLTRGVCEPQARGQRAVQLGKPLERLRGCGPGDAEPRERDQERGDRAGGLREHARSAKQLTHRAAAKMRSVCRSQLRRCRTGTYMRDSSDGIAIAPAELSLSIAIA